MEDTNLFSVSDDGTITYNSSVADDLTEEGAFDVPEVFNNDSAAGDSLSDTEVTAEDAAEVQDVFEVTNDDFITSDTGILSSDAYINAVASSNPTSGTLSSTTLDYFDRVVQGLPRGYGYIAYKSSDSDSYAGSLIYGKDYEVNGNSIVFGEGAVELALSRSTTSSYSYYLSYNYTEADNYSVSLPSDGTTLYYTNLVSGRPTLGSGRELDIAPFLVVALVAVLASVVLNRLIKGRC